MTVTEPLYLRHDVQTEPLIDQWYAWAHLIPPATAARNLTHRHLRILESFLNAPQVHINAARNTAMLGGPFIHHGLESVGALAQLHRATRQKRAELLRLSEALEQLDALLRSLPPGQPLTPVYEKVPDLLRGYVELHYDLHDNASFRLLEALLYRSHFYDASAQSLLLSITTGDERPFALSTPRLDSPGAVHLRWTFDDSRIDELFRLKRAPKPWAWIRDAFKLDAHDEQIFHSFLTPQTQPPGQPYRGSGLRWRYFGHGCILVETKHLNVLLDPVVSYRYESRIPRYTYADLPDRIDYVLITHNHMDHVLIETLLQIRHKVQEVIVPRSGSGSLQDPSLKLMLERIGFRRVREIGELDEVPLGAHRGAIIGIPFLGEHADLAVAAKLAYLIRLGREQILFAADSCVPDSRMYDHLHSVIGDVGTLFIGMECVGAPMSWLYGPLLLRPVGRGIDQARRLSGSDCAQVLALIDRLRCRDIYVYAMGQEPWLNHVMSLKYTEQSRPITESNRLIQECRAAGRGAERLFGEKEILINRLCDEPAAVSA